jgi:deoxyribodipyrimidine photo-lyase
MQKTAIVWFRQDLRLADNPALDAALASGAKVLCVYIHSPEDEGDWPPGGATKWWLHHSLKSLAVSLEALGARLDLFSGSAQDILPKIITESNAGAVYWNRRYEPAIIARDSKIKNDLILKGITVQSFNASLLLEPHEVANKQGRPFQVYTPFWRACYERLIPRATLPKPRKIHCGPVPKNTTTLEKLNLLPKIDWAVGMRDFWEPGEAGAMKRLKEWISLAPKYGQLRDQTGQDGTSRLSPYLHFGEISPVQIWQHVLDHFEIQSGSVMSGGIGIFAKEVVWREFGYHLLYHFPNTPLEPLRADYSRFPWISDAKTLHAWKKGLTGYPMVDAGMRQLWHTGWMHNRVRMIVGSFLVKHLLLPWQEGAKWFWDTLVDADLASNTLGWQWTGGCGADAAPYFRIFNPITQGEKFDPSGDYVRRWIPELAQLPIEYLHKPWEAPPLLLRAAGIELGTTYPKPVVDHAKARERALNALASLKK